MTFSMPGSHPRHHSTFSHYISLGNYCCDSFSDFPCLDDLNSFEECWSGIWQNSLYCDLLDIFLIIRLGLWVIERTIIEVKCHFHHIIWKGHAMHKTDHVWCWPWSPGCCCACQISPLRSDSTFSPFQTLLSRGNHMYSPHLQGVELCTTSLSVIYVNYLEFFCAEDLSVLSYLLKNIYLFGLTRS